MSKKTCSTITVNNKKYDYSLTALKDNSVLVECKAAKIAQPFPAEDVAHLLLDLPNLITAEKEYQERQGDVLRFRVTSDDKRRIEERAAKDGFFSVSEYLRHRALGV